VSAAIISSIIFFDYFVCSLEEQAEREWGERGASAPQQTANAILLNQYVLTFAFENGKYYSKNFD